jgi:hypothetical protein
MTPLPDCARCGHPFNGHIGGACRCGCYAYCASLPIEFGAIAVGDSFGVAGGYRGFVELDTRGTVIAVDVNAVTLRLEDGREVRVDREGVRTGRLRR